MGTQPEYDFPFPVSINSDRDIGGPSAGLAWTLGILNAAGRSATSPVAGSSPPPGPSGPDGSVGDVGGVPQKTVAVDDAGASVFLVPNPSWPPPDHGRPDLKVSRWAPSVRRSSTSSTGAGTSARRKGPTPGPDGRSVSHRLAELAVELCAVAASGRHLAAAPAQTRRRPTLAHASGRLHDLVIRPSPARRGRAPHLRHDRRGFDPAEVRSFLEHVAPRTVAAADREQELRRALAEAERRAAQIRSSTSHAHRRAGPRDRPRAALCARGIRRARRPGGERRRPDASPSPGRSR